jgi:hypothetical protein
MSSVAPPVNIAPDGMPVSELLLSFFYLLSSALMIGLTAAYSFLTV